MASIEEVRKTLLKVSKDLEKQSSTASGHLPAQSTLSKVSFPLTRKKSAFISFESRLMNSFHVGDPVQNQISIAKFITQDTGCTGCILIRVLENHGLFRIYFRGVSPLHYPETYNIDDFACLQAVIQRRQEIIQSDEDFQALSLLVQWKPLFTHIPDVVLAIPILKVDQQVMAVIGLGFKKRLPPDFMSHKMPYMRDFLDTVVPYAMTIQATSDYEEECTRMKLVLDALDLVDKDRRDPVKCAQSIGMELAKLTGLAHHGVVSIFTADYGDNQLMKLHTIGKSKAAQWGCPQPECHDHALFEFDEKLALGWAAIHRKPVKLNESSDVTEYNLHKKALHSVGTCFCKNLMCVPVNDHSGERVLIIELADKEGGFTARDLDIATLFSQNAASIYSCCVMLNHREKYNRRNSMLSQILLNIEPVKHMKVEQFLSHQRKNAVETLYSGPFLEFNFSVKGFSEWDMGGGILHAFVDLDMISTWKIRRTSLIRFILSAQQGYRALPYHNWQHACSVTHFGYLLIKKLKLIDEGYISPLQGFALLVSALVHDIDHRGTNNRFQSCTNSDLFQLYNTQESILERHHLAIALSILRREDCNLIENLNQDDYKEFIELLTWNILATDVAKYLQTRESNFKLLREFKKNSSEHTNALLSLVMTACDVNDCVKTWDDHLVSTTQILTEFFDQGEMEKEMGMIPMPMMDRDQAYIPEVEFKFITGITMPVYRELAGTFSEMESCVRTLKKFAQYWEYSTIIFDANPELENKVQILKWPEMKEENLKKIGDNKDNAQVHIRPLGDETVKRERRGTIHLELRKSFVTKASLNPESEFRQMFTDKHANLRMTQSEILRIQEAQAADEKARNKSKGCFSKCCSKRGKKNKKAELDDIASDM